MVFAAGAAVDLIIAALTAAAVGFTLVELHATILPLLQAIDGVTALENVLADIHAGEDALKLQLSGARFTAATNLYQSLADAFSAGYVKPGQATAAVAYALEISGGSSANLDDLTKLTLATRFEEYGRLVGNISAPPAPAPPRQPPPVEQSQGTPTATSPPETVAVTGGAISPYLSPELAATDGGKLVSAAEANLTKQSVTVPGLSPATAQGITLALAASYHDAITIQATTLNHVLDNLSSIDTTLSGLRADVNAAGSKATSVDDSLRTVESALSGQIDSIQNEVNGIDGRLDGIDNEINGIDGRITTIEAGTGAPDLSGLQGQIDGIDAQLPGFATTTQLDGVGSTASTALHEAEAVAATLAGVGALGLVSTINDLEACCTANSEITGPIKAGGATPGLLGQLGGLLGKAGAIAAALALVDAVNELWDANVVDLTTAQTATVVAPIVTNAVLPSILERVTQQAQLAGT